jgi:hypothetical protein
MMNQRITFLSDDGATARALQLSMNPQAEHILEWFPIMRRITGRDQDATGLVQCDRALGEEVRYTLEWLKWSLWHGDLHKALHKIDDLEALIDNFEDTYLQFKKLEKTAQKFRT